MQQAMALKHEPKFYRAIRARGVSWTWSSAPVQMFQVAPCWKILGFTLFRSSISKRNRHFQDTARIPGKSVLLEMHRTVKLLITLSV